MRQIQGALTGVVLTYCKGDFSVFIMTSKLGNMSIISQCVCSISVLADMEHLANTPLTNNVLQHLGTHNSSFLGVDSCLCYGTSGTKLLGMEHIIYIKK